MPLPPSWAAAPGGGNRRPSWLRLGSDGGEGGVPSWSVGAASVPPALLRLEKAAAHPTLQVSLGDPSSGVVAGASSRGLTGHFPPGRGHASAPELTQFQSASLAEDAPRGWCALWNEVTRVQLHSPPTASDALSVFVHIAPPAGAGDKLQHHTVGGSPYPESAQHKSSDSASDGDDALRVGTVLGRAELNVAACRKWPWQPHACWLDVSAGAALTPPSLAAAGKGAAAAAGTPPPCPVFDATKATGTPPVVPMFRVATTAGARGVILPSNSRAASTDKPPPLQSPPCRCTT